MYILLLATLHSQFSVDTIHRIFISEMRLNRILFKNLLIEEEKENEERKLVCFVRIAFIYY